MARVVVVTGSAGGIGRRVVEAFAAEGCDVIGLDRSAEAPHIRADLGDPATVRAAFDEIAQRGGRIDALVNTAGINHFAPVTEMDVDAWDRMMTVNVGHMILTCQAALPLLQKAEAPAIVNMASVSGHIASTGYAAYVATKAAVESLTVALSHELRGDGIRVNAVAPGWVAAGFTDAVLEAAEDPAPIFEAARGAHLLGRMAEPQEVADAVVWLASEGAAGMSGQVLFVDGGFMRKH
jgi:NAD(P)-dependent dehydrogenase (short-subunit alcohol dehydrogenase family)